MSTFLRSSLKILTSSSLTCRRDDEVLKYLEDFSQDVLPYIRFNTLVELIRKDSKKPNNRWIVKLTNVETSQSTTEEFDAICDCTGHYTRPYIPYVRDLWKYKKSILHAKWFRTPDVFAGKVSVDSFRKRYCCEADTCSSLECARCRQQRVRL